MITRTEQIFISDTRFSELCHYSKNLYNEANYDCRQAFFAGEKIPQYYDLADKFKSSENYHELNAQSGQWTLKTLSKSWKSYLKSIKDYKKHPEKYLGEPRIPHYKHKDGEFIVIFTNQQCHIKDGYLTFPPSLNMGNVKTRLPNPTNLREVRIIPQGTGYVCEIVYRRKIFNRYFTSIDIDLMINRRWYTKQNNKNRILGIDLGLNNIAATINNIGHRSIIIKGSVLKSINRLYNKHRAQLQSIHDRQNPKIKHSKRLSVLTQNRNNRIKDLMHKISRYLINYCIKHNIETIVIGHNPEWKQEIALGKRNNQNFVQIPFNKLIEMLQYKAEEAGIAIKEQEESHTSKCSFIDNEPIEHHDKYMGKRITRGLFRSANGTIINADINGAGNIIRKVVPNAFTRGIAVNGLYPVKVSDIF